MADADTTRDGRGRLNEDIRRLSGRDPGQPREQPESGPTFSDLIRQQAKKTKKDTGTGSEGPR